MSRSLASERDTYTNYPVLPYFLTVRNSHMEIIGDSKLTCKFQVTVPKYVRKLLKLDAGDLLVFVRENEQILLKRAKVSIKD